MSITDWVGDAALRRESSDSLFRRVLSQEDFTYPRSTSHFGEFECMRMQSPLRDLGTTSPGDTIRVNVSLELEQVAYGHPEDGVDPVALWMTGFLAIALTPDKALDVVGTVQWRLTARTDALPRPLVVVRYGTCSGRLDALDRRRALTRANRRALWGLGNDLMALLNTELQLGLKSKARGYYTRQQCEEYADRLLPLGSQ